MDRVEAVRRLLRIERPTRAKLVARAGLSVMCGQRIADGTATPRDTTLARFEGIAAQRREEVIAELQILDVILTR
jgi:hypothetical protein